MFLLGSVARRALQKFRSTPSEDPLHPGLFCFLVEQPEDPAVVLGDAQDARGRPYSSLWRWDLWVELSRAEGATAISTDRGPLGHPRRKPTTLGMIGPGWSLQSLRGPGQEPHARAHCLRVQIAVLQMGVKMIVARIQHFWAKALSREEMQRNAWAQHLAQDHLPRRRDCYHCLAGEFQQKAHRRISVASLLSWSGSPRTFSVGGT